MGRLRRSDDVVEFAAEAELVRTFRPAERVNPSQVVGERRLQLRRVGSEAERAELQTVDVGIASLAVHSRRGGQIDADLCVGDRRLIAEPVADDVDAKAEFVDQALVKV